MKVVIPCLYSAYGRYITQFRSFPSNIDGLKLSERRVLLGLYDTARNKKVKSAKVVGHVIGSYHPHGDLSTYGTLQQLVQRNFAKGFGNWGSRGLKEDDGASAMRYTECQLEKWIDEFAFKYIKFVPWENIEYEDEPLYLPAPIPLGLLGTGVTTGIAFHRSLLPRYSLSDLAKRLSWLLEHGSIKIIENIEDHKLSEDTHGPCITPNSDDCTVSETFGNQFYSLLINGFGSIKYIPYGQIDDNNKTIKILGRAPNNTFSSLISACEDAKKKDKKSGKITTIKKKYDVRLVDASTDTLEVVITASKKIDINKLASTIWETHLIQNLNFSNLVCTNEGTVKLMGIDDLLLNNYSHWRQAVLNKRIKDYEIAVDKRYQIRIIEIIRDIINKHNCSKVDDIISIFTSNGTQSVQFEQLHNNQFESFKKIIDIEDIRTTCNSKTIKQLVEFKSDSVKVDQLIQDTKQSIINIDVDCVNEIKSYI